MKNLLTLLIAMHLTILSNTTLAQNKSIHVTPLDKLQEIIERAGDGDTLILYEGEYRANPTTMVENECGNCPEFISEVKGTQGFVVKGKSLVITGKNPFRTRLITNAGYGFLFLNSKNSKIENLTITGGKRDPDQNATNGGIVVKNSNVQIRNVHVKDNDHLLDEAIIGICGIVGRENSELIIEECVIRNNSWDGIALYRGSKAIIKNNIIEQGRGAGIGITWDARAVVYNNSVSFYWKGIGTFGNSWAIVNNNLVFENLGWGVVISGSSYMELANNVIDKNGNCGVALWDSMAIGKVYNNIITNNGWRDEWVCPQVGFWLNGDFNKLEFKYNNVWNNIMGEYRNVRNLTGENENLSIDPQFSSDKDYRLKSSSPLLNSGSPYYENSTKKRFPIGRYEQQ